MTTPTDVKRDFLGREIKPGDWLFYGRRAGSGTAVSLIQVYKIGNKSVKCRSSWESRYFVDIKNYRDTIIVREEDIPESYKR